MKNFPLRPDQITLSNKIKQFIVKYIFVLPGHVFCPNVNMNGNIMDV